MDGIPRSIQALIRLILTQGDMFFCTIHVCLYNFSSSAELQKERKEYTNIVNVSRFLLCWFRLMVGPVLITLTSCPFVGYFLTKRHHLFYLACYVEKYSTLVWWVYNVHDKDTIWWGYRMARIQYDEDTIWWGLIDEKAGTSVGHSCLVLTFSEKKATLEQLLFIYFCTKAKVWHWMYMLQLMYKVS